MAKKNQNTEPAEGYSKKFLEYSRAIKPKFKINPNDVDEMKRRFVNYCNKTEEYDMHFLNRSCYKALGLSSDQIKAYTGLKYTDNPERGDFLNEVLDFLASYRENAIAAGLLSPIPGIFMQKNYDNMKDVQEVSVSRATEDIQDIKAIAARYQDVIDVEFKAKERKKIPVKTGRPADPVKAERRKETDGGEQKGKDPENNRAG